MSDNPVDKLISDLESTAVNLATQEVMKWLIANVWVGLGGVFVSPIVSWFVGIVISVLIQKLDWLAYMLVDDWETTIEGASYANASKELSAVQSDPNSTADQIAAAQRKKIDAFKKLVSLGSPPSL